MLPGIFLQEKTDSNGGSEHQPQAIHGIGTLCVFLSFVNYTLFLENKCEEWTFGNSLDTGEYGKVG